MQKVKQLVTTLPDKKRYAELITAVLSVPVLITVLLLNIMSLNRSNTSANASLAATQGSTQVSSTSAPKVAVPSQASSSTPTASSSATPSPATVTASPTNQQCTQSVGPVVISSPSEGAQITSDPVCLDISRTASNYCGIVWSYRLNGGTWSEYMDKSICLYNLTPGAKTVDVKIKSLVSSDVVVLTRNFTVISDTTPTPSASDSSQLK